eukprot:1562976-Pleurochrysis_carterae.AAC.2
MVSVYFETMPYRLNEARARAHVTQRGDRTRLEAYAHDPHAHARARFTRLATLITMRWRRAPSSSVRS